YNGPSIAGGVVEVIDIAIGIGGGEGGDVKNDFVRGGGVQVQAARDADEVPTRIRTGGVGRVINLPRVMSAAVPGGRSGGERSRACAGRDSSGEVHDASDSAAAGNGATGADGKRAVAATRDVKGGTRADEDIRAGYRAAANESQGSGK